MMSTTSEHDEKILLMDLTNSNTDLEAFPHPFRRGYFGYGSEPKTLIELQMMELSGHIRSKPNWFDKIKDPTIKNKWKQEALAQSFLSEKQIDYVLNELAYYDSIRDQSIEMSSVDGVWQSDQLIPRQLKESLILHVEPLENVPDSKRDWHPGTDQQILDLVHPSLFCFVNQMTRIINEKNHLISVDDALEYIGRGEAIDINRKVPSQEEKRRKSTENYPRSEIYQWIPTEFDVSKDGKVKINSYINNLHPIQHKQLYQTIESIFEYFIPLFNKVLTDLVYNYDRPNRILVDSYHWYADEEEIPDYDDEQSHRTIIQPDVGPFVMPPRSNSIIDLRGRKLQVIVKLANIILTPSNPTYRGGVWHVEGMENEHIVATGIFYYFNSNISQSKLEFRTVVCEPNYEQDDRYGVRTVYGLENEQGLNQPLGQIITQEDRCLVFPNVYQHRVAPFQLNDPTRIGQRKILVFFLVDPTTRILSTAHIPPQQSHWYTELLRTIPPFDRLPLLVVDDIFSYMNFPMTISQAKQHRHKLMTERKYFISENNQLLFERPFSLCEH